MGCGVSNSGNNGGLQNNAFLVKKLTAAIGKDAQSRKTHRTLRGIGYTWRPLHGDQRHDKNLPRCRDVGDNTHCHYTHA